MPRAYSPNLKTGARAASVVHRLGGIREWHLYGKKGTPWLYLIHEDGTRSYMPLKAAENLASDKEKGL